MAIPDRTLIENLPMFMQDFAEIRQIMEAEQPEVTALQTGLASVWDNQFLSTATAEGVARWESILGITPKQTDTLNERKFRIYALWNQELPYTMTKLQEVLNNLCGEGMYSIILNAGTYTMNVKIGVANIRNYAEVEALVKKMAPANLVVTVEIMYNSHETLHEFEHVELADYTHTQLREDVIT